MNYIVYLRDLSLELLINQGLSQYWAIKLQSFLAIIIIIFTSWYLRKLGKWLLANLLPLLIKRTKNKWATTLLNNKFFSCLSYYILGFVFFCLYDFIYSIQIKSFFKALMGTYFTIITVLLIDNILNTVDEVFRIIKKKDRGNLKIYIQLIKVVLFSFAAIIIISFFANKNLIDILKGLGAMATILLIVYKDTILGFVAGISLSANKMLELGDWICLPKHNADGNVIEIGLNTVKIQNWDMTITTIPPYKLISESFINWKGMEQSGGRRIKRAINIDIDSIRFLSKEDIEKFSKFQLLHDYINTKITEIPNLNNDNVDVFNNRRLTNIGTFRKYIENYLISKQIANTNMTFLVRQLQSNEKGLPIEIYFFSKEKAWAKYEEIQADIFDHIFAITKEFDLKVFQNISAASTQNFFKS